MSGDGHTYMASRQFLEPVEQFREPGRQHLREALAVIRRDLEKIDLRPDGALRYFFEDVYGAPGMRVHNATITIDEKK